MPSAVTSFLTSLLSHDNDVCIVKYFFLNIYPLYKMASRAEYERILLVVWEGTGKEDRSLQLTDLGENVLITTYFYKN